AFGCRPEKVMRSFWPRADSRQPRALHSFHLPIFQFDRRRAAENVDHDCDLAALQVDGAYFALEAFERAVLHFHAVADLELDVQLRRLGRLFFVRRLDAGHFVRQHRRRLAAGTGEVADARRLAHRKPGFVVDVHPYDDVTRVQLSLDDLFLAG